jgi:hypothetical protein
MTRHQFAIDLLRVEYEYVMKYVARRPTKAQAKKVANEAKQYSSTIFANYHLLKQILERHEATIKKR